MKGAPTLADSTTVAHLEATRFGTLAPAARIKREVAVGATTFRIEGPLLERMVLRLASRSATYAELVVDSAAGLTEFPPVAIRSALAQLALADVIEPRPAHDAAKPVADPIAFNRAALDAAFTSPGPVIVASSRAGTAIMLPRLKAALLHLTTMPAARRAEALSDLAATPSLSLWTNDQKVTNVQARRAILATELRTFEETELAKLTELGLVTPDAASTPIPLIDSFTRPLK